MAEGPWAMASLFVTNHDKNKIIEARLHPFANVLIAEKLFFLCKNFWVIKLWVINRKI